MRRIVVETIEASRNLSQAASNVRGVGECGSQEPETGPCASHGLMAESDAIDVHSQTLPAVCRGQYHARRAYTPLPFLPLKSTYTRKRRGGAREGEGESRAKIRLSHRSDVDRHRLYPPPHLRDARHEPGWQVLASSFLACVSQCTRSSAPKTQNINPTLARMPRP